MAQDAPRPSLSVRTVVGAGLAAAMASALRLHRKSAQYRARYDRNLRPSPVPRHGSGRADTHPQAALLFCKGSTSAKPSTSYAINPFSGVFDVTPRASDGGRA